MEKIVKKYKWVWVLLAVIGIIGIADRFWNGHRNTNYGSYVPWGLWVAMYIYFIGLSAGAFLMSSMVYVFNVKAFKKIGPLSLITALVTLICALLSIALDLGHMGRAWKVLLNPHFSSMMVWMVWLYTCYLILLSAETFLAFRPYMVRHANDNAWYGKVFKLLTKNKTDLSEEALAEDQRKLKKLGTIGVPLAVLFHGGVGALFGVVAAVPHWHSAITPIYFLVGALVSGAALMLFVLVFLWEDKSHGYEDMIKQLASITMIILVLDLVIEWAEFSIALWGGTPHHKESFLQILFGPMWWNFWIIHIVLGVSIPLYFLIKKKDNLKALGAAGGLIAFTFLSVRLNIVIPGLSVERVSGIENAFVQPKLSLHYLPSWSEWFVASFIVALGLFLFYQASQILPVLKPDTEANPSGGNHEN